MSVESVRDILIRLSRGDLLDYCEMGGWFRKAGVKEVESQLYKGSLLGEKGRAWAGNSPPLVLRSRRLYI